MMSIQNSKIKDKKVALVYDRVNTTHGGAEKVLLTLKKLFPNAPLYTSVYDEEKTKSWAKNFIVVPSFLQNIPILGQLFVKSNILSLPFLPIAFENFDLSNYDIVISITSAEAKGILTKPDQLHICYLLTPTRYLYSHQDEYMQSKNWLKWPIIKQVTQLILKYLTWWDQVAILRPDIVIPISELVAKRAKKYYPQAQISPVIYPPLELAKIDTPKSNKNLDSLLESKLENQNSNYPNYLISVCRLVDYKRVDIAIKTVLKINKFKLIIVGTGPELENLKALCIGNFLEKNESQTTLEFLAQSKDLSEKIYFLKNIDETDKVSLIKHAKASLHIGEEDFGLSALESVLLAIPIVIHYKSGVAEMLSEGLNCVTIQQETVTALEEAIPKALALKPSIKEINKIKENASEQAFLEKIERTICHI